MKRIFYLILFLTFMATNIYSVDDNNLATLIDEGCNKSFNEVSRKNILTKVIVAYDPLELQHSINNFSQRRDIIDIKFCMTTLTSRYEATYAVLIIYRE